MDNVTHTLAAVALAKTGIGRASRLALPAIIVAANVPDLDYVVRFFGGMPAYFAYHRGITHSLPGIVMQVPLLATLFWVIEKLLRRRAETGGAQPPAASRTSWWGLVLAVALGLATQPLFDWFNTYGVRPWLPFDDTWHYGDLAFIIDPWLWLLFGGAAALAGQRSRAGNTAYGAVAVLGFVFILTVGGSSPPALAVLLPVAWIFMTCLLALARWRGVGCNRPATVVGIMLTLTAVYLLGMAWAGRTAWDRHRTRLVAQLPQDETLQGHMWSPQPGNPFGWTLIAETQRAVYVQTVDLLNGAGRAIRRLRNLDDPLVRAALATPDGQAWRAFARFPIAQVVGDSSDARVLLLDARYPLDPPQRNWCRMVIDLSAEKSRRPP